MFKRLGIVTLAFLALVTAAHPRSNRAARRRKASTGHTRPRQTLATPFGVHGS